LRTVGFGCVDGNLPFPPQYVLAAGYGLKMIGIDACDVAAQVVENKIVRDRAVSELIPTAPSNLSLC